MPRPRWFALSALLMTLPAIEILPMPVGGAMMVGGWYIACTVLWIALGVSLVVHAVQRRSADKLAFEEKRRQLRSSR